MREQKTEDGIQKPEVRLIAIGFDEFLTALAQTFEELNNLPIALWNNPRYAGPGANLRAVKVWRWL